MQGFEVVSLNDEKCIGHVVERSGDNLIVEHGHLRHRKNALPLAFAEIDEANERVTTTLSAQHGPRVAGGQRRRRRRGGGGRVLRARRRDGRGLRRHAARTRSRPAPNPTSTARPTGGGACGRPHRRHPAARRRTTTRAPRRRTRPPCSATEPLEPRIRLSRNPARDRAETSVSRSVTSSSHESVTWPMSVAFAARSPSSARNATARRLTHRSQRIPLTCMVSVSSATGLR